MIKIDNKEFESGDFLYIDRCRINGDMIYDLIRVQDLKHVSVDEKELFEIDRQGHKIEDVACIWYCEPLTKVKVPTAVVPRFDPPHRRVVRYQSEDIIVLEDYEGSISKFKIWYKGFHVDFDNYGKLVHFYVNNKEHLCFCFDAHGVAEKIYLDTYGKLHYDDILYVRQYGYKSQSKFRRQMLL